MTRGPGLRRRSPALTLLALAGALVLAACTYGGKIDEPVTQKVTWFSYLNGDDLRKRCGNVEDLWEVRLVYNGDYKKQVRTYHVVNDGAGGAYLTARASPEDAGSLTLLTLSDPQAPWRWNRSQTRLSPAERQTLESRLADSGLYGPTPTGLRLKSWGSYWVAIACKDGTIHYNAWTYGSERWPQQNFQEILADYDATNVPFMAPKAASYADAPQPPKRGEGRSLHFQLQVGENGLKGVHTLF